MAFRVEPDSKYPFKPEYKHYKAGNHYSKDGLLLSYIYSENEDGASGLKLRSVHRWTAKTPQYLADVPVKHYTEEAGNFPEFLPELYAEEGSKAAT